MYKNGVMIVNRSFFEIKPLRIEKGWKEVGIHKTLYHLER